MDLVNKNKRSCLGEREQRRLGSVKAKEMENWWFLGALHVDYRFIHACVKFDDPSSPLKIGRKFDASLSRTAVLCRRRSCHAINYELCVCWFSFDSFGKWKWNVNFFFWCDRLTTKVVMWTICNRILESIKATLISSTSNGYARQHEFIFIHFPSPKMKNFQFELSYRARGDPLKIRSSTINTTQRRSPPHRLFEVCVCFPVFTSNLMI